MGTLTNSGKLIEKIESLEPVEYSAGAGIDITDNKISADIGTGLSFSGRLPSAYQEVEYIESGANGGTQFIQFTMPYYDSEGYYSFEVDAGNVGDAEGMLITFRQSV